jgi:hypothetical protein
MSTSGKDPVRGLPQTDEESSRSYFTLSKHHRLLLPPFTFYWFIEWRTSQGSQVKASCDSLLPRKAKECDSVLVVYKFS